MESQRLTRIQTEAFFFLFPPFLIRLSFFSDAFISVGFSRAPYWLEMMTRLSWLCLALSFSVLHKESANFVHQAHNRSTSWQTYGNSLWRESCLFNQAKWIRFFVHIRIRFLNLKKKVKALVLSCAYGTVILYAPRETKLTYLHSSITIFFGVSNFYDELNYIIYSNVHLE